MIYKHACDHLFLLHVGIHAPTTPLHEDDKGDGQAQQHYHPDQSTYDPRKRYSGCVCHNSRLASGLYKPGGARGDLREQSGRKQAPVDLRRPEDLALDNRLCHARDERRGHRRDGGEYTRKRDQRVPRRARLYDCFCGRHRRENGGREDE
jgi:hypothetical protein